MKKEEKNNCSLRVITTYLIIKRLSGTASICVLKTTVITEVPVQLFILQLHS